MAIILEESEIPSDLLEYFEPIDIPDEIPKSAIWNIPTRPFHGSHFAVFPETLIEPMIKAGCPEGGLVYDPFMGAGTVAVVAKKLGRHWLGSELNPEYIEMANKRIDAEKAQLKLF